MVVVLASTEVDANLRALNTDTSIFSGYIRHDVHKIRSFWARYPVNWKSIDHVLNIFGPVYSPRMAWRSTTGLARPQVAFPSNAYERQLPWLSRVLLRAQSTFQALFFRLAAQLVVEQEAVRQGLLGQLLFRGARIEVVPSTVDEIYWQRDRWQPIELPESHVDLRLGVVAYNYDHKNLKVLPEVRRLLAERHGISSAIYVTSRDEDWAQANTSMQDSLENVGELSLAQCPSFNSALDAVVFPTLLECFSATPIEAKAVGVPLFASDLPVIRETVGNYATYFNPLDPSDIADSIAKKYPQLQERAHKVEPSMEDGLLRWTASDRARALLNYTTKIRRRNRRSRGSNPPGRS